MDRLQEGAGIKQTLIGNYELGVLSVALYLREGDGAEYYTHPEPGATPRIKIGAIGPWDSVISRLLHEAMEYTLDKPRSGVRPKKPDTNQTTSSLWQGGGYWTGQGRSCHRGAKKMGHEVGARTASRE